jgi:hypothetical protein
MWELTAKTLHRAFWYAVGGVVAISAIAGTSVVALWNWLT